MKSLYLISLFCYVFASLASAGEETVPAKNLDIDHSNSPRVESVKRIDEVIQRAVEEGWTKAKWTSVFGPPRRSNKYNGNFEFIQYYESGPFEKKGKEIITGITIKLKNDRTFGFSYRRTTFDLPDHPKFEGGG